MEKHYVALAYYIFEKIENPHTEVKKHKEFFENLECAGRIYISEEGINGQMSGTLEGVEAYIAWLKTDPRFSKAHFKLHPTAENVFPRMTVKYRKQLVALDLNPGEKLDVHQGGAHVSPEEWRKMLEEGGYLVLDVRNKYEWEIGHFENAVLPPLNTFREFPAYAEALSKQVDPQKTKVMMYCTGGIRCELYSAVMKNRGFQEIYQLDGGVINYGLQEGSKHWKGKLFVFDDRLAVSIDGQEAQPIAQCNYCQNACDTYYNCANMDCNELFICCADCVAEQKGCCSTTCQSAARLRPFDRKSGNKPFRRKHLLNEASSEDATCAVACCRLPQ